MVRRYIYVMYKKMKRNKLKGKKILLDYIIN